MMTSNPPKVEQSLLLRKTLGCFPTGVIVVTTLGDNNAPVGMTINSFSSVSMQPPLVLWNIANSAPSRGAFQNHPGFTLNILSDEQESIGKHFARPSADKFKGIDWRPGFEGTPIITDCLAVIQCRTFQIYAGGDHEIFLGEVIEFDSTDKKPLVFYGGQFVELADKSS